MLESGPGHNPDAKSKQGGEAMDIAKEAVSPKDLYRKLVEKGIKAKVYVTLNTEYVIGDDDKCVAAVDRHTDKITRDHMAVGRKVDGGRIRGVSGYIKADVGPGASLLLDEDGLEVITSTVITVKEPTDFLDNDGASEKVA